MNFRSPFILLVLLLFFLALEKSSAHSSSPRMETVEDMMGRTIELPKNIDRIVCLGPGALRLVVYLQVEKKLVGVEELEKKHNVGRPYWLARQELAALPICGPGGPASINKKPDMERLLALNPQLIIVTYMEKKLLTEVQKTLDIPILGLTYGAFASFDETVYKALRLLGKIFHKNKRAEDVINFIEAQRLDLTRRTKSIARKDKPLVYVGGIGYKGAQGIDSTDKNYVPFQWLSAKDLGHKMRGKGKSHHFFGKEALLLSDPEIIFIDGGGLAIVKSEYERKSSFYKALTAFRKKRVYTLWPINWYTTNIGTAIINAYTIGQKTFSKQFKDVNLNQKAAQVYEFLVGKSVVQQMERDYGPIGKSFPTDG